MDLLRGRLVQGLFSSVCWLKNGQMLQFHALSRLIFLSWQFSPWPGGGEGGKEHHSQPLLRTEKKYCNRYMLFLIICLTFFRRRIRINFWWAVTSKVFLSSLTALFAIVWIVHSFIYFYIFFNIRTSLSQESFILYSEVEYSDFK